LDIKHRDYYQVVVVDVGIFWRYYKWIYNPLIRIPSSSSIMVFLGLWHPYKELCQIIYQKSIRFLFGPLLGQFSDTTILYKPKLGILETYFTWFMIAYHYEKEYILEAIKKTNGRKKKILKNILFIFTSAIPFVCK